MIIKNNVLIEVDENDINDGEIKLPNNIISIKNSAFKNVLNLIANNRIKIMIPNSVISVGDDMHFHLENKSLYIISQSNKNSIPGYFINVLGGVDKSLVFFSSVASKNFFSNFSYDLKEFSRGTAIEKKRSILKFAKLLGCFSTRNWDEKNKSNILVCHKATSILFKILKSGINLEEYSEILDSLPIDIEIELDFLNFLINQNDNFECLKILLTLEKEKEFKGIFLKTVLNFNEVLESRNATDIDGKPIKLSIQDAYKAYFRKNKTPYENILPKDQDIANLFSSRGVKPKVYYEAVSLRDQAIEEDVPPHLLGESNKENTILELIEEIKRKTEDEIDGIQEQLAIAYEREFTYEWLNKRHAINGILGLYTNCCASLTRAIEGRKTAKASILAKDVQNLIIRDSNNNIIAKGTFYLNRKLGYGVINSFSISSSVKKDKYGLIMDAFMRGLDSFIRKYDEIFPHNPIIQINTGISHSLLKIIIERFKKSPELLSVPEEYNFHDAIKEQYILYKRPNQLNIIGDR